jgi:Tn3 transposase DDE domain
LLPTRNLDADSGRPRAAWNILHIESIVNQLRAEGKNCDDHILSLTTPLMRKHLNPFGRYYFDLNRMRRLSGEIP